MAAAAMSSPEPATRRPAVMARPGRPARPPGPGWTVPDATPAWLVRSVPTTAPAGGARGRRLPGGGDFMPHAAVDIEAVAVGLARGAVGGVGVQRGPVVGDLLGAVRPAEPVRVSR